MAQKEKSLWQTGALFHATTRYPRKKSAPRTDRLAGILRKGILAPAHCALPSAPSRAPHELVDWWQAAFLMISCWEEAQWEEQNGPAQHSHLATAVMPQLYRAAQARRNGGGWPETADARCLLSGS